MKWWHRVAIAVVTVMVLIEVVFLWLLNAAEWPIATGDRRRRAPVLPGGAAAHPLGDAVPAHLQAMDGRSTVSGDDEPMDRHNPDTCAIWTSAQPDATCTCGADEQATS